MNNDTVVLVTVSGQDAPGIVSAMTKAIAATNARILDIEQVVIHNRIILVILLDSASLEANQQTLKKDLLSEAKRRNLEVDLQVMSRRDFSLRSNKFTYALTCLGDEISAATLAQISSTLASFGVNIERINRLSQERLNCAEMIITAPEAVDTSKLRQQLMAIGRHFPVDIALQRENIYRKSKRLVVMDVDSTLIQGEVIDELAKIAGVGEQVADITHRAMSGELNFEQSLRQRVALLKGLPWQVIDEVYDRIPLTPGANKFLGTLKHLGYKTGIISGGFSIFTLRLQQELGLDYAYANNLEVVDGRLTGGLLGPIVDGQEKARLVEEIASLENIPLEQTVAIGDGANDLLMLEKVGLGIAFNAKKKVREAAECSISRKNLDSVLFLLGISEKDVAEIT